MLEISAARRFVQPAPNSTPSERWSEYLSSGPVTAVTSNNLLEQTSCVPGALPANCFLQWGLLNLLSGVPLDRYVLSSCRKANCRETYMQHAR
jgi:hypothetical protein